jgi:hypothetical protein
MCIEAHVLHVVVFGAGAGNVLQLLAYCKEVVLTGPAAENRIHKLGVVSLVIPVSA